MDDKTKVVRVEDEMNVLHHKQTAVTEEIILRWVGQSTGKKNGDSGNNPAV